MSTSHSDLFARLVEPFHADDVKVRSYDNARYITARSVMNRLDDVLGPECWDDEYERWGDNAVLCRLTVYLPDGRKISKSDVGANSTMAQKQGGKADPGEDDKGGASDAFKRAAVKFGIGRYLYNDGYVNFAATAPTNSAAAALSANGHRPTEDLPKADRLFDWCKRHGHVQRAEALASSNFKCGLTACTDAQADFIYDLLKRANAVNVTAAPAAPPPPARQPPGATNENGAPVKFGWPRSGSALFAWSKNLEGAFQASVIRPIDGWLKDQGWPTTYKDLNPEQVEQAALFAARRIKALPGYDGQFDDKLPSLDTLKSALADAAKAVLTNGGAPDPSYTQICEYLDVVAKDLGAEFGGELVGDLEACQSELLLKAVLAGVEKDRADGSDIPF